MKYLVATTGMLLLCVSAQAGADTHWSYTGASGPEHWGELSPEFSACANGRNQSPIDLDGFIEADLAPIEFRYRGRGLEILNNGHTLQVNHAPGDTIGIDGRSFELKQYHFHAPSENRFEGKTFPLEAHLVHADAEGNLAVVAVMFETGAANEVLAQVWSAMPRAAGTTNAWPSAAATEDLLPSNRDYYRFNGSLTTPPCTEGVRWLVLKTAMTASSEQIAAFAKVLGHPNNRPVQDVNARPVLR